MVAILAGCGPSAPSSYQLSGDIFVTMQSGDVKRGAGVEVFLISDNPQFQTDWKAVIADRGPKLSRGLQAPNVSMNGSSDKWLLGLMIDLYGDAALKLAGAHKAQSVRTDANGHYEIKSVKAGRYYVFARHQVFDERVVWMVPIDLTDGSRKLDLSNHNQGLPPA